MKKYFVILLILTFQMNIFPFFSSNKIETKTETETEVIQIDLGTSIITPSKAIVFLTYTGRINAHTFTISVGNYNRECSFAIPISYSIENKTFTYHRPAYGDSIWEGKFSMDIIEVTPNFIKIRFK